MSVVACYPGTPSSEISDTLAVLSEDFGFHMEYSANEKVALEVAAGAAIAGGKGLVIMKHVGLNVASDAFFPLAYKGISGALVVIVCDDPFMFSSQTEEDTRLLASCASIPVLDPSNLNEAKEMIKEAFVISERLGTPVMLRPTTRISHTSGIVELGDLPEPKREKFTWDRKMNWWQQYVAVPDISRVNHLKMIERIEKVRRFCEETQFNQLLEEDSDIGVLVSGVSFCYVLEALDILDLRVSVFQY